MLAEIPREQLAQALDEIAAAALSKVGLQEPPIDALRLAKRLGLAVAWDDRQSGRARRVQFAGNAGGNVAAVLVRHDPRAERLHWAIAHEVGELLAEKVFAELAVDPPSAPIQAREFIANALASRLLLPGKPFFRDSVSSGWDLLELKQRYHTASHELIARRMLDFSPPIIISVFDQNQLTWRRSNVPGRAPKPGEREIACRGTAHESGLPSFDPGPPAISAWPIHEAEWQREIVRVDLSELAFDGFA
jgi:hypothetical protein